MLHSSHYLTSAPFDRAHHLQQVSIHDSLSERAIENLAAGESTARLERGLPFGENTWTGNPAFQQQVGIRALAAGRWDKSWTVAPPLKGSNPLRDAIDANPHLKDLTAHQIGAWLLFHEGLAAATTHEAMLGAIAAVETRPVILDPRAPIQFAEPILGAAAPAAARDAAPLFEAR